MIEVSCVVMFLEKLPVTFTSVSAEIQKNFCEFENVEPKQLKLNENQTIDDIPNDIPIYIFPSEMREILLAKGRFVFNEHIKDELTVPEYCNRIGETVKKISSIFKSNVKFNGLKYRLGIVVEANFSSKETGYDVIKNVVGDEKNLQYNEIELSVNDKKDVDGFSLNCWKRVYINEHRNSFLVDINNHVDTPCTLENDNVYDIYIKIIRNELEVILNDLYK